MKTTASLLAATLLTAASLTAQAGVMTINGADLGSTPGITLPSGPGTVAGTSLQFTTTRPGESVALRIDLAALGFGGSGASSGSVAITNTRLGSDSDLWYGLWDGTDFLAFTSFDGDRSMNQSACGATSNGSTFTFCLGADSPFAIVQNIGDPATAFYDFDLTAGSLDFSLNGVNHSGSIPLGFGAGGLEFLLGFGTGSEDHQIDLVEISGLAMDVPEPTSLALLSLGLIGSLRARRRH